MRPTELPWHSAPDVLDLADDEVHVWQVSLTRGPEEEAQFRGLLTADEVERAARFHFEKDRSAFIARRGILRLLVGRYMARQPFRESFELNAYGKPSLPSAANGIDLRFNVSFSHSVALMGVTRGRDVGVDIEWIRPDMDYCSIAESFFSLHERYALRSLSDSDRAAGFFACWARKEAYIKARGTGLSMPLDQFDVTVSPDQPPLLLATRDDPLEATRWSLETLYSGPDYAAALAIEGHGLRVSCWEWP